MDFFVPNRKSRKQSPSEDKDTGSMVIVLAKRMHLSFDELNEITMRDLVDIAEIYTEPMSDKPKKIKASQADIDKFTGWRG